MPKIGFDTDIYSNDGTTWYGGDDTLDIGFTITVQSNKLVGQFQASGNGATLDDGDLILPFNILGLTQTINKQTPDDGMAVGDSITTYNGQMSGSVALYVVPAPESDITPKAVSLDNLQTFKEKCDDTYAKKTEIPEEYTLPVANASTLGGVKPVAKTSEMTQNVGVDSNGVLYTKPAPDISEQVSDLSQSVDDIYTILQQEVYNSQDIEQEYSSRETADGADIIDGALETVKKIQGATVKTTNQFDISKLSGTGISVSGNTITVTSNGSSFLTAQTFKEIIPNAKAGNYTFFGTLNVSSGVKSEYCGIALPPSSGRPLYISPQYPTNGNNVNTFTVTESDFDRPIGFSTAYTTQGQSYNWSNIMIIEGNQTSNTPAYMPYFSGLKNAYFKGLRSTGRNLIPFPYSDGSSKTFNGITYTVSDDGSITLNGTATSDSSYIIASDFTLYAGNYYLSGCPSGGGYSTYNLRIYTSDTTVSRADNGSGIQVNSSALNSWAMSISVESGTAVNNLVFRPMLNYGSSALPYEPYISHEISLDTAIELPAWDSIDPTTGKRIVQSNTLTFDGTENWLISSVTDCYTYFILLNDSSISEPLGKSYLNLISNKITSRAYQGENEGCYLTNADYSALLFWFKQTAYPDLSTVDAWKAQLAAWNTAGAPLTVCYQTATATESDISMEDRLPAYKNGSETVIQGETDNSEYGAENTLTQNYAEVKGTTGTTEGGNS